MRILLDRHRESLFLFLLGYVRNEADAEELMMDSFAVIVSGTSSFLEKSSFKTWLFAIARNQAKMFLRKKKGFFISLEEALEKSHGVFMQDHDIDTPDVSLLKQERNQELYKALERLPASYRQALYLIYFEEMNIEEAATIMHKNKKQIYNLLTRGRKALKETLKRMGFDYERYE